jgi:hypothetical protein
MTELQLRAERVSWTEIDGEIVALDVSAAVYLAANETGAMLWRALAGGSTREKLVQIMIDAYGLPADQAAADIDAFLSELQDRDLVVASRVAA